MHTYVARQPIFTRDRDVFGYELLFRGSAENRFTPGVDEDHASAKVLNDTLHLHGLDDLGSGGKCFINITPKILLEELYTTLPPESAVLEILETVEPTDELLAACRKCREAGYSLALDDYILQPEFNSVLAHIDILKVDYLDLDASQRHEVARLGRRYKFKMLAEKVETYEEFHQAKLQGYDYFQGYFFCKPEMISRRDVPHSQFAYLQLLQQLTKQELNLGAITKIISQDVALSYKLLRYLNSSAFGFRHEISSIERALALLGDRPLRKWASLIVLSMIGESKPMELLKVCMVRARTCEQLAAKTNLPDPLHCFMAGMFSVLDGLLDQPMYRLVQSMSLPAEVKATLLGDPTPMQKLLELIKGIE